MSDHPAGTVELIPAPDAPAGAADASRRWGLRFPDGHARFPGVTRPEGAAAAAALGAAPAELWPSALVEITLDVLLTEGAGPYALDADGRVTLVLAPHPLLAGCHLAMGEPRPGHRVGLVRRRIDGVLWEWVARSECQPSRRVEALGSLDALASLAETGAWERAARA